MLSQNLDGIKTLKRLNDKLSLILYTIYFLSYDKFFAGRNEPIFLKSFNGKDPAYYLNETQCKNLLLSIEAASAVVESKERINREVEMLKNLFKSKTSYELVIPDHVMTNILELYKSNEVDAFYAELFEFISKNYDDFMEGLSDFLFDPNIGFRASNFNFLTSKCICAKYIDIIPRANKTIPNNIVIISDKNKNV